MQAYKMSTLAVKILGLYFCVFALSNLPMLLLYIGPGDLTLLFLSFSIYFLALFGSGICLLLASDWITRKVIGISPGEEPISAQSITISQLQWLAFAVTGLVLIGMAIKPLSYTITEVLLHEAMQDAHQAGAYIKASAPQILGPLVQLAFGFFLFLRARKIAGWWERREQATAGV